MQQPESPEPQDNSEGPESADEMAREHQPEQPAPSPEAAPAPVYTKPFEGARAPARFGGVLYQYNEAVRGWSRHILRRYADRGSYWSRTFYVPANVPFCMRCLTTHGRLELGTLPSTGEPAAYFQCLAEDCGIRYTFDDSYEP